MQQFKYLWQEERLQIKAAERRLEIPLNDANCLGEMKVMIPSDNKNIADSVLDSVYM